MHTSTTFLALISAAGFISSCANNRNSEGDIKPDTVQVETRRTLYSSFNTIGEPYDGISRLGTASGWRGSETILLEGGYLLTYSVHYRGSSALDRKSVRAVEKSDHDLIYNMRINPHKGWTTRDLDRMYPPNKEDAEQGGTGQTATRSESKSESSDKTQPEAEGCSR